MIPWYWEVIVVVPQETAVARPVLFIVATAVLLDSQVATLVRLLLLVGAEYTPSAMN
jgi:hypothetical protein